MCDNTFDHSRKKKRKDSPKGSPDRVLFTAQLEFSKILVPRLPQITSNVNIKCEGNPKQLYSLYPFFSCKFSVKLSHLQSDVNTTKLLSYYIYDRYFIYRNVA